MWWIFPSVFLFGIATFSFLFIGARSENRILRKLLFIPARKSITNAVQLGGLPLSLSIIFGFFHIYNHESFHSFFSILDHYTIKYWLVSSGIIVLYGYLDDKFELRPFVKLALQLFSIGFFATLESRVVFPKWGALAFLIVSFWGLGVINGSNLLDGLDTLTIKIGIVTFGVFLIISYNFKIPSSTLASLVAISSLLAFYFFNKEPAKIHLGEIGGSFIGFTSVLVSCLVFSHLIRIKVSHFNALNICLLPLTLPMVELGISFVRRIYSRRSPFKGDKYHLHHILKNYYGFSPSKASTIYALCYALVMISGITIMHFYGPFLSLVLTTGLLVTAYVGIGRKHWKSEKSLDLKPKALFDYLIKKNVGVIYSSEVEEFELKVISGVLTTSEDPVTSEEAGEPFEKKADSSLEENGKKTKKIA